jgi:hypothetical protein
VVARRCQQMHLMAVTTEPRNLLPSTASTRRWPGRCSRSASHAPTVASTASPSTPASTRRMVASPGTWQRRVSGSRRTPSAARTGQGASAAHSAIAVTLRAPAGTAAALTASTLARVCRRPRRSRGSGIVASRSSRPGHSPGTSRRAWSKTVTAVGWEKIRRQARWSVRS